MRRWSKPEMKRADFVAYRTSNDAVRAEVFSPKTIKGRAGRRRRIPAVSTEKPAATVPPSAEEKIFPTVPPRSPVGFPQERRMENA